MSDRRSAWVSIDLGAISHNVRTLKALTEPGTLFMAVVKADGYGHGAERVARTALAAGADRLGVATLDEALYLRETGITAPIQLFSEPPASAAPDVIDAAVTPTVTTRSFAVALGTEALRRDTLAEYHLKIDTGMNRIGVRAEDAAQFALGLTDYPGLRLSGTLTHFATADTPGDWDFDLQMQRFSAALAEMRGEGINPGIVHSANSAATILHPESHFGMVRCGIACYGLHPAPSTYRALDLRPAMSVHARVTCVKRIGMGDGVSYGMTWRATAPTTIATLPLGYADGVHRVLSDRMDVLIGGVRCRQVGRVCMDQLMVEVTDDVRVGNEAVIVGSQGSVSIVMDEVAEAAGTINYEMACAFGMRLKSHHSL